MFASFANVKQQHEGGVGGDEVVLCVLWWTNVLFSKLCKLLVSHKGVVTLSFST